MPKFKAGDIIADKLSIETNAPQVMEVTKLLDDIYSVKLIHCTTHINYIGRTVDFPTIYIDKLYSVYNEYKPAVSDCTCTSWDMLHKGCKCGYSKALGNVWGLAGQFRKVA